MSMDPTLAGLRSDHFARRSGQDIREVRRTLLGGLLLAVVVPAVAPAAATSLPKAAQALCGRFRALDLGVQGRSYTTLPVEFELSNPREADPLHRLVVQLFTPVAESAGHPFGDLQSLAPAVTARWRGQILVFTPLARRFIAHASPWPVLSVQGSRADGSDFEQYVVMEPMT